MASEYHGLMFLGFSACLPQGVFPDWLYYPVFCPSGKVDETGQILHANYGMRKIEAAILAKGFKREEVIIAHPDYLYKVVDADTKIVSISSNDPLGIGPATSTFVELWGGEGRMAVKLRELLNQPCMRTFKPTIFLGGPGSWQLAVHAEKQKELGIHHVVVGEGEITAPMLFHKILEQNGAFVERVVYGETAQDTDIADIVGGSVTGLVEVTRGCARSCAFCVPTVRKVRSRPLENILREVKVNIACGNTGAILHGEDIFLYKSDGLNVNAEAVIELFDRVYHTPGVNFVGISHASISSAVSSPQTVQAISRILELGSPRHPVDYFEIGIETGSPKLIRSHMRGKVYPFDPQEWPEIVRRGFKLFSENSIVPSATIIMGLPGEDREDVEQTTELIRSLRSYKSIIVPLLFTPMETTRLEYAKPFLKTDLTARHYELLSACWDHNLDWLPAIWSIYSRNSNYFVRTFINLMMKYGTTPVRNRMHKHARKHGAQV
jgi:radical SAM superfamily enzyme YgiQ (UPF0313 family)